MVTRETKIETVRAHRFIPLALFCSAGLSPPYFSPSAAVFFFAHASMESESKRGLERRTTVIDCGDVGALAARCGATRASAYVVAIHAQTRADNGEGSEGIFIAGEGGKRGKRETDRAKERWEGSSRMRAYQDAQENTAWRSCLADMPTHTLPFRSPVQSPFFSPTPHLSA